MSSECPVETGFIVINYTNVSVVFCFSKEAHVEKSPKIHAAAARTVLPKNTSSKCTSALLPEVLPTV